MGIHKLTAVEVSKFTESGKYADGGGLYLYVSKSGTKAWVYRYQLNNKTRYMGLGAYDKKQNSLAAARESAADARAKVKQGIDPIDVAQQLQEQQEAERERLERERREADDFENATFRVCAEELIEKKKAEWKNVKHHSQWNNSLRDYVYPHIGDMPVNDIDVYHVRKCLDPIWLKKTETASRVRQRIESVISSAIANQHREAMRGNPAMWKGLLENFYPNAEKVKRKKHIEAGTDGHFAALPYEDMPDFMARLVELDGFASMALRFLILTVPRTTELRLAKWEEIDFDKRMWTIPAGRMKASKQHRVPLSDAAIELLQNTPRMSYTDLIFPGWRKGSAMSESGLSSVLRKRLNVAKEVATVHGFRSTFRDYIGEETGYPERLAEYALAHQLSDQAERAYARGDKLKKRFDMMNTWANYCDSKINSGSVIPIGRKKAG